MRISVLISTFNRKDVLRKTLESLLSQDYPLGELEVVVLDDAGTDGTYGALTAAVAGMLARGLRGFRVFRNEKNEGIAYGRGRLTALADRGSEALLYLDDDVYMDKNTLAGLARCLADDPGCGLTGPRLVYAADPARTAHCANFVGRWSGRYSETDPDAPTLCDWLNSSCFLARAAAATKVSHAAEFHTAHEEVDFCLQLGRAGWRIVYYPLVRALHDLPLSSKVRRERLYYLYRNKLLLFRRNFSPARLVTASLVTCCFGLPLYIIESLSHNKGVDAAELRLVFKAVVDGLRGRGGKL